MHTHIPLTSKHRVYSFIFKNVLILTEINGRNFSFLFFVHIDSYSKVRKNVSQFTGTLTAGQDMTCWIG